MLGNISLCYLPYEWIGVSCNVNAILYSIIKNSIIIKFCKE